MVGGCSQYAGAPYFSAHAAATIGADMVHVVCGRRSGPTLQLFLPDLMVHPLLTEMTDANVDHPGDLELAIKLEILREYADKHVISLVLAVLDRSDFVILGPGLGRDALMLATAVRIIEETKVRNLPLLIDADGLFLTSLDPLLVAGYKKAIVTPNVVEFSRLARVLGMEVSDNESSEDTISLSQALGDVMVIRKGPNEVIALSSVHLVNTVKGSLRRVGGQGDTLSGTVACLVHWLNNYLNGLWKDQSTDPKPLQSEAHVVAAASACAIVRIASRLAFEKYGRLMQTSYIHQFLHQAYLQVLE